MGPILSYSIISSIVLLFCYLPYRWFMANQKQYAINRFALLSIYGISLISPLVFFNASIDAGNPTIGVVLGVPGAEIMHSAVTTPVDEGVSIWMVIVIAYAIGLISFSLIYFWGIAKVLLIIKKADLITINGKTVAVTDNESMNPFNWRNTIVINRRLYDTDARPLIVAHESAHIEESHWIDLLISQIIVCLQWYNPAAWMLRDCLKDIHEFQADECVLKQGIAPRKYQLFLVSAAFSSRFNLPVDFLSAGNIRKRICMMREEKSNALKRFAVIALLPFMSIGIFACNLAPVNYFIRQIHGIAFFDSNNSENEPIEVPVPTEVAGEKASEVTINMDLEPQNGHFIEAEYIEGKMGLMKFLADNIKYPQEAEDNGMQGKVIVSFKIDAKGEVNSFGVNKSVDRHLEAEVLRVCGMITKFKPATLDGSPVESIYNLPINFVLPTN